jgi:hypothetical protein
MNNLANQPAAVSRPRGGPARWVVAVNFDVDASERVRYWARGRGGAMPELQNVMPPAVDAHELDRRGRVAATLVDRATNWRRLPAGWDDEEEIIGTGEVMIVIGSRDGSWAGEVTDVEWAREDARAFDADAGDMHLVAFSQIAGRPVAGFARSPGRLASLHRVLPLLDDDQSGSDDRHELNEQLNNGPDDENGGEAEPAGPAATDSRSLAQRIGHMWLGFGCAAGLAIIGLVRFATFTNGDGPATIDSGNWLAFAESIFGGGGRDPSIVYPPLIPFLTHIAVAVFGLTSGIALVAAFSSIIPAAGLYIALTMARVGPVRVFPVMLVAGLGSVGEAASWGGFPQLWSMGMLPIGVVLASVVCDRPTRRTALQLGAVLMFALATSHLGALVLVGALVVSVAVDAAVHRSRTRVHAVVGLVPLVVLPSVWLIPTYLKLIDAVVLHPNEFAVLDNLTPASALSGLANVAPETQGLWQLLVALGFLAPFLGSRDRTSVAWRATTTLLISVVVLLAVTRESRYLSFVPFVTAATVGVWIDDRLRRPVDIEAGVRKWVGLVVVVLSTAVVVQVQQGHSGLADQRDFYGRLTDDLVSAIFVADDTAPNDGAIAIPSLNDAPLGWWVEGLTEHDVIYGSPLRWLNFSDEVERATIANTIFDPTFPNASSVGLLNDAEVSVLILPRQWAWYEESAVDAWIESNGFDVPFSSADVLVIDLEPSEGEGRQP